MFVSERSVYTQFYVSLNPARDHEDITICDILGLRSQNAEILEECNGFYRTRRSDAVECQRQSLTGRNLRPVHNDTVIHVLCRMPSQNTAWILVDIYI